MVKCELCGRDVGMAMTNRHLKCYHSILLDEYRQLFPKTNLSWNNGLNRETSSEVNSIYSVERNAKITQANIATWANPNVRSKRVLAILENYQISDQSIRNKHISEGSKLSYLDPIKRENHLKHIYARKNNPKYSAYCSERNLQTIREKGWKPENNARVQWHFDAKLGHIIRSSWEHNFATIFKNANIRYLYEPVSFDLEDCFYTPDFFLLDYDCYIELSGFSSDTKIYKLTKMQIIYPYIKIYLVEGAEYQNFIAKYSKFLEGGVNEN
jgi:hypothetical protein